MRVAFELVELLGLAQAVCRIHGEHDEHDQKQEVGRQFHLHVAGQDQAYSGEIHGVQLHFFECLRFPYRYPVTVGMHGFQQVHVFVLQENGAAIIVEQRRPELEVHPPAFVKRQSASCLPRAWPIRVARPLLRARLPGCRQRDHSLGTSPDWVGGGNSVVDSSKTDCTSTSAVRTLLIKQVAPGLDQGPHPAKLQRQQPGKQGAHAQNKDGGTARSHVPKITGVSAALASELSLRP